MEAIAEAVRHSRTIAVVSHTNPDGDTVGCGLALVLALRHAGFDAVSVCDCALPADLSALPGADIFGKGDLDRRYDLAFCVDCSTTSMLGLAQRTVSGAANSVCIDHHLDHDRFTRHDVVTIAAANTENVYEFLHAYFDQYIDKDVAECLFTGLVTDSGGFTYGSVTSHTHAVAAALLAYGVDNERVCYEQLRRLDLRFIRARSDAYAHALYAYGGRVAIVVFSCELMERYGLTLADMGGSLVEMMRADDIVIACSMVQTGDESYKVSVRSKNPYSAAAVANTYGGGGHFNAAGCRLTGAEGVVIDLLLEAIDKQMA